MRILKKILLIAWSIFCFIGITWNFSYYDIIDWLIVIPFVSIPYSLIFILFRKHDARKHLQRNGDGSNNITQTNSIATTLTETEQTPVATTTNIVTNDNSSDIQNKTQFLSTNAQKQFPKCNCDGCLKQENCKYGHTIYDEYTHERLSLADKFIMLSVFDELVFDELNIVAESNDIIIDDTCLTNVKLLLKQPYESLRNTLDYLQAEKKQYVSFGKCGRAYYNFMQMNNRINCVKKALKEYKSNTYNTD